MDIIKSLKNKLIVSCQALEGEPLHVPGYMAKMALAASRGGASGIRANGPQDIRSIKAEVDLPIIGIWKIVTPGSDVYITPTLDAAREVYKAGADIIAVDATFRKNSEGKLAWEIIKEIKKEMDVLVMADVSTVEEGIKAVSEGADIIGTTLSGYTAYTIARDTPDFDIIKEFSEKIDVPIMAEGRIASVEDVIRAFELGAYCVTVGGQITRPMQITEKFVAGIDEYFKKKQDVFLDKYFKDSLSIPKEKIIFALREISKLSGAIDIARERIDKLYEILLQDVEERDVEKIKEYLKTL